MEEIGLCPQGEKSGNAEKLAEYICSSKYLKSTYIKLMYLISYIYTQVYAEAEQYMWSVSSSISGFRFWEYQR